MRARGGGKIVEISSVLGFVGLPYSAVYVASKHAVNGLVKSLRLRAPRDGGEGLGGLPGTNRERVRRAGAGVDEPKGPIPRGAATDKVVRAIVRGWAAGRRSSAQRRRVGGRDAGALAPRARSTGDAALGGDVIPGRDQSSGHGAGPNPSAP